MANFSSDVHFMHDDFSELLWDNGPVHTSFSHVSQAQEKDNKDSLYPHIGHFRQIEPKVHMYQVSGSSGGFGFLVPNDDADPWNYAVEEPLRNIVYCPESVNDYPEINIQNVEKEEWNKKVESTWIESRGCLRSSMPSNIALGSSTKSPKDVIAIDIPEAVGEEDSSRKNNRNAIGSYTRFPDQIQTSSFASSAVLERPETDKGQEAVLASSGSSAEPVSNDHNHSEKRTRHGYQSEDVGDESLRPKKPATSRGKNAKRNRAAEVHNLSERVSAEYKHEPSRIQILSSTRRRRDRINEKMRALQELIPNCNKTDKASMLDEAIEYLKSLKMQVQIMSMRGGLCVHPMMMQHMRAPTMPQFWPLSVGMGVGNGWGYMNGSPGCQFVPVAPFHHAPGSTALPVFGNPGPRFPVPMAHREAATSASAATTLSSKDHVHQGKGDSQIRTSTQARKEECFEELKAKKTILMK